MRSSPFERSTSFRDFTLSSAHDYQPIEALKLAFSARYSDSHFEFPTGSAGDRLSPLDPDQYSDRQCLVLSQCTTHAITRWWEQILLLGYNRIDFQFVDPNNGAPVDFSDFHPESLEQRLLLNYLEHDAAGILSSGDDLDHRHRGHGGQTRPALDF